MTDALAARIQTSGDLLDAYMDARLDLARRRSGAADRVQQLETAIGTLTAAARLTPGTRVRFAFDLDAEPQLSHIDGREGTVVRRHGTRGYYVTPDGDGGPATVRCGAEELEVVGDD